MNALEYIDNDLLSALTKETKECAHEDTYIQSDQKICSECGVELCMHAETEDIDGLNVCIQCGEEINEINFDKEWRFYGTCDNKTKRDPARCHKRKENTKNIYPYVEGLDFVQSILANANEKYVKIKNDTHRGKNNKAVIAACIYAAYIDEKEPKPASEIGKIFGLNKKSISKGFETFYEHFPNYRTTYIEPCDLIRRILIQSKIDINHYTKIKKMCKIIENNSSIINRSTPQSIACAVVYLYVCLNSDLKEELGLSKSKFTQMVGMSDITITKICKIVIETFNLDVKI